LFESENRITGKIKPNTNLNTVISYQDKQKPK